LHNLKIPSPLVGGIEMHGKGRGKVFIYLRFSPSPLSPPLKGGEQFKRCAKYKRRIP